MLAALKAFAQHESGATAIEYGLLTGLLAIGVTMSLSVFGDPLEQVFNKVSTQLLSAEGRTVVSIIKPDPA
jgi:pilus assembly protein Flp/PilA